MLKISSSRGLDRLHISEKPIDGFRKHALQSDNIIGRFTKNNNLHPLVKTNHTRWSWVGQMEATKRHILYFHGGGFCADMPATFRYWADRLATLNDASVLLVDYPLAPESPYPAALNECLDAYRWMIEDQNLDPRRIVIGGDSAGGNLAVATLLKIKEMELPMPACAFVLSPSLDLTFKGHSMIDNKKTDAIGNIEIMRKLAQLYAPRKNFNDGLVSPIFGDCRDLSPIQLQVSATELLRDDSIEFFEKFKNDTPVELVVWDNAPHCHQIFGILPESVLARRKIQTFVAEHC